MSRLPVLLARVVVPCARRRMLGELVRATADGFGTQPPAWSGSSFEGRLADYARFTAREAERLVAAGDDAATEAARARLYGATRSLGAGVRTSLRVRTPEDALAVFKSLYRRLGIEIDARAAAVVGARGDRGSWCSDLSVGRCFFAPYYSPPVCRVVEALDQGLVAGLFAGARLEFRERLTDGASCCRACIRVDRGGA